jgi:predicted nucleic acid-binding protein
VDTNVVSYIFKQTVLGTAYARLIDGRSTAITLLSIAELSAGVSRGHWGYEKVRRLDTLMSRFISVPGTTEVATFAGFFSVAAGTSVARWIGPTHRQPPQPFGLMCRW